MGLGVRGIADKFVRKGVHPPSSANEHAAMLMQLGSSANSPPGKKIEAQYFNVCALYASIWCLWGREVWGEMGETEEQGNVEGDSGLKNKPLGKEAENVKVKGGGSGSV